MRTTIPRIALLLLALSACSKAEPKPANSDFIWDFSEPKTLEYTYADNVVFTQFLLSNEKVTSDTLPSKGTLTVSARNGRANVDLDVLATTEPGQTERDQRQVLKGMKESGDANSQDDFHQEIMLPLPTLDLKEGESDRVKFSIATSVNGDSRKLDVVNTLTHAGLARIAGRECMLLKGVLSGPKKVHDVRAGQMHFSLGGTATYCFDIKEHVYVSANVSYWLRSRAIAKSSMGPQRMGMDMAVAATMQLKNTAKQ